eukprot:gene5399-10796_t
MFESQLKTYQDTRKTLYTKAPITPSIISAPSNQPHFMSRRPQRDWCTFGVGDGPAKNSLKVCTIPIFRGIALHIHYAWPIFIILAYISALQISQLYGLYSFILGGPILFLTVLIHELGHCAMAIRLGGNVNLILLWPLGGLAYISFFGDANPKADILVAIAGPLTHIPQIIFWYGLLWLTSGGYFSLSLYLTWNNFWPCLCSGAVMIQISLFLFNLIPAFPLDGGRVLSAALQLGKVSRSTAFKSSAIVGASFGFILLFRSLGVIMKRSSSFFWGWNTLALSLFILNNCRQLWALSQSGDDANHPGYQFLNRSNIVSSASQPLNPSAYRMNQLRL